ncbi:hypothetical protein KY316_00695 [Candidatus Woesearchaeota archaeon]|nr:hypothetical protein [Candidatus Woesearchaeota archaeon]
MDSYIRHDDCDYNPKIESSRAQRNLKRIKWLAAFAAFSAASAVAWPHISNYWQKRKATQAIAEADSSADSLKARIEAAKKKVEDTKTLFLDNEEAMNVTIEIEDSEAKLAGIEALAAQAKNDFANGCYRKVRQDIEYTEQNPSAIARAEDEDLMSKVIKFCSTLKATRNENIINEWYLKARLKKPIEGAEKPEELKDLPDNYLRLIPRKTNSLDAKLKELDSKLYNSLGANIVRHRPVLEHIIKYGKNPKANERAQKIFDDAQKLYLQVMPRNDKLIWFRAEKHDGRVDYFKLQKEQHEVIELIKLGDGCLSWLDRYMAELHLQYFEMVSRHHKEEISFLDSETYVGFDADGDLTTKTRTVSTPGYKFFYILTTVTPKGKTEKKIEVGQLRGLSSEWEYKPEEQVGFVTQWKRLHYDNSQKLRGKMQPKIEQVPVQCRK